MVCHYKGSFKNERACILLIIPIYYVHSLQTFYFPCLYGECRGVIMKLRFKMGGGVFERNISMLKKKKMCTDFSFMIVKHGHILAAMQVEENKNIVSSIGCSNANYLVQGP